MGILGLSKLLFQECPGAMREEELKNYFGRRIAIDASMSIYQFVIAMKGFSDGQGLELTNENGEVTSHLNGLFSRTLRMIDEGLKPIYVFDGKPPEMKRSELEGRKQKAQEAQQQFEKAKEAGDDELMEKMSKRTVRVSKEETDDCKKLLRLMGLPIVEAPSEAEAQCAELVRSGKAWGVATEDMDALTFGSKILIRHLNVSDAKKHPIVEYRLDDILSHTGLTMESFVDLCILLGCDYTGKIPGIGPQRAWEGIKAHASIEGILSHLDASKRPQTSDFDFESARELFHHPEVIAGADCVIEFREPDDEGLLQFLVEEKLFSRERVVKGIQRLRAALNKKVQGRLDQFFKVGPKPAPPVTVPQKAARSSSGALIGNKRARPDEDANGNAALLRKTQNSGTKKAVLK